MKLISLLVVISGLLLVGCEQKKKVVLKTDRQKWSYAVGQQIGKSLKSQSMDVDIDVLSASIDEAYAGKKERLTQAELQGVMMKMRQEQMKKQKVKGEANKAAGDKFLAENKKKKGIKVTDSGLQYEVLTEGKGAKPKLKSTVVVHYKGTLMDGSEFDSSYKRNQPAEFPLKGVIKGWTEALQLMKTGSKYKLYIPPQLAYGGMDRPGIPANSVLIFEVELLEIKK